MNPLDLSVAVPATTYIIASTMRTGSYLLCEGLEEIGRAGHPMEVFCPERRENYTKDWRLPRDIGISDYIREITQRGTTENGVFGMKIQAHHVEPLARECDVTGRPWQVLRQLFPSAKYIHLDRRDRRAQAISWYRALVTNEWWRIAGEEHWDLTGRQPQFNAAEIHRLELDLASQHQAWKEFFAAQPLEVMDMEYETLAADYRGEIARVMAFIGEDPALARALPDPRMIRQSDETTERWHQLMDVHFPVATGTDTARRVPGSA